MFIQAFTNLRQSSCQSAPCSQTRTQTTPLFPRSHMCIRPTAHDTRRRRESGRESSPSRAGLEDSRYNASNYEQATDQADEQTAIQWVQYVLDGRSSESSRWCSGVSSELDSLQWGLCYDALSSMRHGFSLANNMILQTPPFEPLECCTCRSRPSTCGLQDAPEHRLSMTLKDHQHG